MDASEQDWTGTMKNENQQQVGASVAFTGITEESREVVSGRNGESGGKE